VLDASPPRGGERSLGPIQEGIATAKLQRWPREAYDAVMDDLKRALNDSEDLREASMMIRQGWVELYSNQASIDDAERIPSEWRTPAQVLEAIPQPKCRFRLPGLPSLEKACRGGLPTGIVLVLAGWPDAGKTGLGTQIVLDIAREKDVVAVLFTPDGGQEATAIRIGGLIGLDQDKLEARDSAERAALDGKLQARRIFIVDDSRDGMVFERIRTDAERVRPDLPHIYLLDSAQECLATEKADELDERHRAIALMRAVYRTVEANPIPSLAVVTSQVSGQAFAPSRKADRTQPMGAPAESKKISFLSHLIVSLEGDPSREPDFGRAAVVKSKLRGPKPSFGLRLDALTSRLEEIDAVAVEQQKTEQRARERTEEASKLGEEIAHLLAKHGALNVAAVQERARAKRERVLDALGGLEAQGVAAWTKGSRGAHVWNLTDLGRKTGGAPS
jgi:RecA/RadA recombinase